MPYERNVVSQVLNTYLVESLSNGDHPRSHGGSRDRLNGDHAVGTLVVRSFSAASSLPAALAAALASSTRAA